MYMFYDQRDWEVSNYLTRVKGDPIHSIYIMGRYSSGHYSWFHGSGAKVKVVDHNPMFAHIRMGQPLPESKRTEVMRCNQILNDIMTGTVLPEYIWLNEEERGIVTFRMCERAVLNLEQDGKRLYTLEKEFGGDLVFHDDRTNGPRNRQLCLYHLDMANFTPF